MGGALKGLGKALDIVKPFITAINPALGAAVGFASGLMQGKNPLQAAMGAAMDLFPGANMLGNVLGKFGGSGLSNLMDGMGGNSLLHSALNFATGKGDVTDIVGDLIKNTAKDQLTKQGLGNAQELSAQRMAQLLFQ